MNYPLDCRLLLRCGVVLSRYAVGGCQLHNRNRTRPTELKALNLVAIMATPMQHLTMHNTEQH